MSEELKLNTPIEDHCCKAMKSCESISIEKRYIDGEERWMWEQVKKSGKIEANEIFFCPYCGTDLNRRTQQPNNKLTCEGCINANTAMCERCIRGGTARVKYGFTDTYRAAPENKPLTPDELRQMDTKPVWCTWSGDKRWGLVCVGFLRRVHICISDGTTFAINESNEEPDINQPIVYRRPPEEDEKK